MKLNILQKILLILIAALSVIITPNLEAQEAASLPKEIQFSCVTWKTLSIPELYYQQGEEYLPVVPKRGFRSPLYSLKGELFFKLFKKIIKPDDEVIYKLVGRASIPKEASQMLFLIEEVESGKRLPLRVFAVKDSIDDFPAGSYRFINFTQNSFVTNFCGTKYDLPSGKITKVVPPIPKKGGLIPIKIFQKTDKIFESRLFAQPTGREMVFIYPSTGRRSTSIKFLSQLMGPKKKEADQQE